MVDQIRNELRSCAKRGVSPPPTPDAYALWDATGGDGPLALLVAIEFYVAKRQFKQEQAEARKEEEWWLRAA